MFFALWRGNKNVGTSGRLLPNQPWKIKCCITFEEIRNVFRNHKKNLKKMVKITYIYDSQSSNHYSLIWLQWEASICLIISSDVFCISKKTKNRPLVREHRRTTTSTFSHKDRTLIMSKINVFLQTFAHNFFSRGSIRYNSQQNVGRPKLTTCNLIITFFCFCFLWFWRTKTLYSCSPTKANFCWKRLVDPAKVHFTKNLGTTLWKWFSIEKQNQQLLM